jgi:hypothetical protein
MKQYKNYAIIALTVVIVVVLALLIRKNKIYDSDIQSYKDSLNVLIYMNYIIEQENDSLLTYNDSLTSTIPVIKTIYREKYIFIEHSDINELDSLIRSAIR